MIESYEYRYIVIKEVCYRIYRFNILSVDIDLNLDVESLTVCDNISGAIVFYNFFVFIVGSRQFEIP